MADANYLRRYQSAGSRKRKSKKKDRDKKQAANMRMNGMRIVEVDADDWGYNRSRENEGLSEAEDEAPLLVDDVIRKELPRLKKGTWSEVDATKHGDVEKHLNSDDDLSPLRKGRIRSDDENSMPVRKGHLDSDDEDLSPPRKGKVTANDSKLHPDVGIRLNKKENLWPPRNGRIENDDDLSPPRKGRIDSDDDLSPPRKGRIDSDDEISPPRKGRIDSDDDLSLPRKGRMDSDDDLSPPRHGQVEGNDDISHPRKGRIDSDDDISPPRGGREHSDNDLSPPRKGRIDSDDDISPPRGGREHNDNDLSPPRRSRIDCDEDEPHDSRQRALISTSAPSQRTENLVPQGDQQGVSIPDAPKAVSALRDRDPVVRTTGGHVAGLIKGSDFREAEAKLRAERAAVHAATATKPPAAETVYRDRRGRKLDMLNEFMRIEAEREGRRREAREEFEWGRGTKQKKDEEAARQELETMKNEPFARSIDDPQLEKMRREALRDGDPMVQYVLSKRGDAGFNLDRASKSDEAGSPPRTRNVYKGPNVAPNRYGIKPGYRWDGIDRSNGWEAKLQTKNAEAVGLKGDSYAWSSADM